ncbi:Hypothetical predicted protein [Paramuricea clavata]|uniref:Uncharacterized protein n=1 Tax=Paramuricea clavata TaxID=317549 RepID=A0A6S7JUB4_PARCT|nr:Hypothetical predicted protein [Paramuricea clavata]
MSKFMQRIDDKIEGISQEVNNLKANTSQPERIDLINNLKREIDELKNENLELRQRNATISYAMADLQTKLKDMENEKNPSLITAIKLVQLDQSKPSGTKNQVDNWHVVRNKKPNVSKDAHKTAASIADVNRYEVLSDSDVEPTEGQRPPYVRPITAHKNPGNKESTFDTENEINQNLNGHRQKENQSENKPNIAIVGDSMIKNINPRKLSRKRVNKFTFPGKRAEDCI